MANEHEGLKISSVLNKMIIIVLQVNYYANELWAKFLRQADIAKDDLFRSYIPKWVEVAVKKAIKVGYPSQVRILVIGSTPK